MPPTKTATAIAPLTVKTDLIKKEGSALIAPLRAQVEAIEVHTDADYLEADGLLGQVRNNRKKWELRMQDVLSPAQEAHKATKKALDAAKALHAEFDAPLAAMEQALKEAMKAFKVEEMRQIQAAEEAEQARQEQLVAAQQATLKALTQAKTAPMRERLAEKRRELEAQQQEAAPVVTQIKGTGSVARKVKKWRISDMKEFLTQVIKRGNYTLVTPNETILNAILRNNENELVGYPGIEVYDDVIIAGR